jgi:hypothetical protein
MAKSKEELMAHSRAVRAALKKDMTPDQVAEHQAAVKRKEEAKKTPPPRKPGSGGVYALWDGDEFELSIDRSLARFLEALEGCERHHKRSWVSSRVVQDFAAALDEVRGMVKKEVSNG